jgi:hypothetical protein
MPATVPGSVAVRPFSAPRVHYWMCAVRYLPLSRLRLCVSTHVRPTARGVLAAGALRSRRRVNDVLRLAGLCFFVRVCRCGRAQFVCSKQTPTWRLTVQSPRQEHCRFVVRVHLGHRFRLDAPRDRPSRENRSRGVPPDRFARCEGPRSPLLPRYSRRPRAVSARRSARRCRGALPHRSSIRLHDMRDRTSYPPPDGPPHCRRHRRRPYRAR